MLDDKAVRELWAHLDEIGREEVRLKIAQGVFGEKKKPIVEEWLRRQEASQNTIEIAITQTTPDGDEWANLKDGDLRIFCFMSVDIVGHSAIESPHRDIETTFHEFENHVRQKVTKNYGRVFSWQGDGGLCAFLSNDPTEMAEQGVPCGLSIMESLEEFNAKKNTLKEPIKVRIAIHIGDARYRENTGSIQSDAINFVVHLEKKGTHDNTISISGEIYKQLSEGLKAFFHDNGIFEGKAVYTSQKNTAKEIIPPNLVQIKNSLPVVEITIVSIIYERAKLEIKKSASRFDYIRIDLQSLLQKLNLSKEGFEIALENLYSHRIFLETSTHGMRTEYPFVEFMSEGERKYLVCLSKTGFAFYEAFKDETKSIHIPPVSKYISDKDALNIIESWMGSRQATLNTQVIHFSDVDNELKLAEGTAKRLLEKAAQKWHYHVRRKGEDTILFEENRDTGGEPSIAARIRDMGF